MAKDQPLWLRLYAEPHIYELARIVGYAGVTTQEGQQRAAPLLERFGREKMAAAHQELLDVDKDCNRVVLKPDVRRLCFQLLGPPPEQRAEFEAGAKAPPPMGPPDNTSPAPAKPRRRRKGGLP